MVDGDVVVLWFDCDFFKVFVGNFRFRWWMEVVATMSWFMVVLVVVILYADGDFLWWPEIVVGDGGLWWFGRGDFRTPMVIFWW